MAQTTKSKRIGLISREQIINELEEKVKSTHGCFFVRFNKVLSMKVSTLRTSLRNENASVFVAKNTLISRAMANAGYNELNGFLQGETGVIVSGNEDIAKICKILTDFGAENEAFAIKGGFIKDKKVSAGDISTIAKLPGKDQLRAMALSAIAAPISGFVTTMNQILQKFLWTLEEVKKTKK